MEKDKNIVICGAGLVGSLLSLYLAREGYKVVLMERRIDPRPIAHKLGEGRSINLAISKRGLSALKPLNLSVEASKNAIPMLGRLMHSSGGELTYQTYGKDDSQYINSISRGWLNRYLLEEAEKTGNVEIHFEHNLESIDTDSKTLKFLKAKEELVEIQYDFLFGTDGSSSRVRKNLESQKVIESTSDYLPYGYKELTMPGTEDGQFRIRGDVLHIWPRGKFMMIALPNQDKSFTCTLFLQDKVENPLEPSFDGLSDRKKVEAFFLEHFLDFTKEVPDYLDQFFENPTGRMVTVRTEPWNYKNDVLLLGDASHAIVPFFGQGMNSGFEDVRLFVEHILEKGWDNAFPAFSQSRKPDADAIADMALDNFVEMSARTADPKFLYQKKIELRLQNEFPENYTSRYSLVSFTNTPYRVAQEVGRVQKNILNQLTDKHFPSLDISLSELKSSMGNQLNAVMEKVIKD